MVEKNDQNKKYLKEEEVLQSAVFRAFDRFIEDYYEQGEHRKLIRKIAGKESSRIGNIAESITAAMLPWFMERYFQVDVKRVFRGIEFENPCKKDKKTGENVKGEIDVLAVGEEAIVVVEAKTSVTESQVHDFNNKTIKNFSKLKLTPSKAKIRKELDALALKGKKVYGGIAFIGTTKHTTENEIIRAAEKDGLFGVKIIGKNSIELCTSEPDVRPLKRA